MNHSTGVPTVASHRLTSALYRECLPNAEDDPKRAVDWMIPICLSVLLVGIVLTKKPAEWAFIPDQYLPPTPLVIVTQTEQRSPPEVIDLPKEANPSDEMPREILPAPVQAVDPSQVPFAVPTPGAVEAPPDVRPPPAPAPLVFRPNLTPIYLRPSDRGTLGDLPWPTDRDYPQAAKSRKESGEVVMIIDVGPNGGGPSEVTIEVELPFLLSR